MKMKRHITIGVLLFLFVGLGTLQARGEVVDTLSAEVTETDWEGGVIVSFTGDTTTSVKQVENAHIFCNVYDLRGKIIRKSVQWDKVRKELPSGIYIVNRRKSVIRNK